MEGMTKLHPSQAPAAHNHDYLPAAGRDAFLRFYDPLTVALGAGKLHRTLIDQARLAPGLRVLEIGCGTGNLSIRLKRSHPGVEVVGSDPDPLALARAQRKARRLRGIQFERGYAQRLPYPDASFDRVFSSLMLHHLDQDTKPAAAAEVLRVLRPGGSLHLVDFTGQSHGASGIHDRMMARRMMKSGHIADNVDDAIPRLLDAAGLDSVAVEERRHPIMGPFTYYRATRPA